MTGILLLLVMGCGGGLRRIAPPAAAQVEPAPVSNAEARHQYLLGRVLLEQGRVEEAAAAFDQARRFDPTSARVAMAQADAALVARDVDGALAALQQAVSLQPQLGEAWLRLARIQRMRGALDEAEAGFRRAVEGGAGWHARAELIEVLLLADDRDAAAQAVQDWAAADEALPGRARRIRAEARLAAGDREGALDDLDAWLLEQPEDHDAVDLMMVVGQATGHSGRVLELLDREARALPADPDIAQRQASFADSIGHAPRLLAAIERLQSLDGHLDPGLDVDRARALLLLLRPADALALLDGVRALDPRWPQIDLWRAQALVDLGRGADAAALLKAAPQRAGETPWRVDLLRRAGDPDAARQLVDAALAQRPGSRPVLDAALRLAAADLDHAWGLSLAAQRAADAERLWRGALVRAGHGDVVLDRMAQEVAAGDADALRDSAALLMDDDPAESVRRLRRALTDKPDDGKARALLAGALVQVGLSRDGTDAQLEEARTLARERLADDPGDAAMHNLLAWSCAAAGQCLAEARAHAERAVDIDPADGHLVDTLGWALARGGDLAAAERILAEAAALLPDNAEIAGHLAAVRAGVLPAVRSPAP